MIEVDKIVNDFDYPTNVETIHPFLALKLKKKRKTLPKSVSQSIMDGSTSLNFARLTIKLNDSEHEIVESIDGYQIDGVDLTFDSWSKFSGSDNRVVSCKNNRQFRKKINLNPNVLKLQPPPPPPNLLHLSTDQRSPSKTGVKKRRLRSSLEEGEIASWLSSDDESDAKIVLKKTKSAERREQKRPNVQNSPQSVKQRMEITFNNRIKIISHLNASQSIATNNLWST
uniref:Uncharacterized protein n=1 Tax=Panagrolaimus davidi TaxID=227884 RepID=A0A914QJI3_9BILA